MGKRVGSSTKKNCCYQLHDMCRSVKKNHVSDPHSMGVAVERVEGSSTKMIFFYELHEMCKSAEKSHFKPLTSIGGVKYQEFFLLGNS